MENIYKLIREKTALLIAGLVITCLTFSGIMAQSNSDRVYKTDLSFTQNEHIESNDNVDSHVLRNYNPEGDFALIGTTGGGYVFGTNEYNDQAKAEGFVLQEGDQITVSQVHVTFGVVSEGGAEEEITFHLVGGTLEDGPDMTNEYTSVTLTAGDMNTPDGETPVATEIHFESEVEITGTFFVVISWNLGADVNAFGILSTDELGSSVAETWEQWDNDVWHNVSEAWREGTDGWNMIVDVIVDEMATSAEPPVEIADRIQLHNNYPNPFNPSTNISFTLPEAADVTLTVYNSLGREVATVADGMLNAGDHSYTFDASNLSSGLYFYRLTSGNFTRTQKMSLIK